MIPAFAGLILTLSVFTSGSAWSLSLREQLDDIHTKKSNYCSYFSHDEICGGNEREMKSRQQRSARDNFDYAVNQFGSDVLEQKDYENILLEMDRIYNESSKEYRQSLEVIGVQLNRAWLERYQDTFDLWLATAADRNNEALALGWVIYSTAFTVTPQFQNVPALHRFLRGRIPWAMIAVGTVGTSLLSANQNTLVDRPQAPPPPFAVLRFGENDEPGSDVAAQMNDVEFRKFREMFSTNAGLMTVLAAGPNWAALAGAAGRLGYIATKLMSATRITPVSASVGYAATELVSWGYTQYRLAKLTDHFLSADESLPTAAQELSVSINGLHLLFLADIDTEIRQMEKLFSILTDPKYDDQRVKKIFSAQAMNHRFFKTFTDHAVEPNANEYFVSQISKYQTFSDNAEKLARHLSRLKQGSPLKNGIISRRVEKLKLQSENAKQKLASFPVKELSRRLLALYASKQNGGYVGTN